MRSREVDPHCDTDQVMQELERILSSSVFSRSKRLRDFLRFTIAEVLNGRAETVSEWSIGVAVYNREQDYDPQLDSIVRSEARRLRAKLWEYYAAEGASDPLIIEYPKGTYIPLIRNREPDTPLPVLPASAPESRPAQLRKWLIPAGLVAVLAVAGWGVWQGRLSYDRRMRSESELAQMIESCRQAYGRFVSQRTGPSFNDAERRLRSLLSSYPQSAHGAALLCSLYERRLNPPTNDRDAILGKAESYCRQALRLDPENGLASATLGWLLVQQRDAVSGVPYLQVALRSMPNEPTNHLLMGQTWFSLGFYESAAKELREAIRLDATDALAAAQLGVTLAILHQPREARTASDQAIRMDPFSFVVLLRAADATMRSGDLTDARIKLDSARSLPLDQPAVNEVEVAFRLVEILEGRRASNAHMSEVTTEVRRSYMDHQIRIDAAVGKTESAVSLIRSSPIWRNYRYVIGCLELRQLRSRSLVRDLVQELHAEWVRNSLSFGPALPEAPASLPSPTDFLQTPQ